MDFPPSLIYFLLGCDPSVLGAVGTAAEPSLDRLSPPGRDPRAESWGMPLEQMLMGRMGCPSTRFPKELLSSWESITQCPLHSPITDIVVVIIVIIININIIISIIINIFTLLSFLFYPFVLIFIICYYYYCHY